VRAADFDMIQTVVRIIGIVLLIGLLGFALFVLPLMVARVKVKLNEKHKNNVKKKAHTCLRTEMASASIPELFEIKHVI